MTRRKQVYKCLVCGIVAEVLEGGAGEPICCGQAMVLLEPRSDPDAPRGGQHVPVLERTDAGWHVRIGQQAHPSEQRHWIQWILLETGGRSYRAWFEPGDTPEATFPASASAEGVTARALCNVHGLWQAQRP